MSHANEPQRILIVRLSALGDVVHALPMLDALRRARPDAHIGWLVEEAAASLLDGHPQIDRVWVAPRGEMKGLLRQGRYGKAFGLVQQTRRALRSAQYDLTLDVQCNLRSAFLAHATGAPRRIAFAPPFSKEGARHLATELVTVTGEPQSKVERDLEILRPLGIDPAGARSQLAIPEEDRVAARTLRAREGAMVGLHPGVSGFGSFKRWAPERYAQLARRLHDDRGVKSLVTWGPGEEALASSIVADADGAAVLAPATRSLRALGALYEVCDVVVAADTGPLHLAAALGVPTVGLYGPKDPAIYGPWNGKTGEKAITVWKHVHCSPCKLRRCNDVICMPAITVDDVSAALEEPLSAAREPDLRRGSARS
jgi:lipopolysaccharide heptosyltransferase I